jgi:hypothetical protein
MKKSTRKKREEMKARLLANFKGEKRKYIESRDDDDVGEDCEADLAASNIDVNYESDKQEISKGGDSELAEAEEVAAEAPPVSPGADFVKKCDDLTEIANGSATASVVSKDWKPAAEFNSAIASAMSAVSSEWDEATRSDDDTGFAEQADDDAPDADMSFSSMADAFPAPPPPVAHEPPAVKLPSAWRVRARNVLCTGRAEEVVLALQPFECLYLEGSVDVSAIVGTCRIFGATLTPGDPAAAVRAVPPSGPMAVEAPGARLAALPGIAAAAADAPLLAALADLVAAGEDIACAVRLRCRPRRRRAAPTAAAAPPSPAAAPPSPAAAAPAHRPVGLQAGKDAVHGLRAHGCRVLKEGARDLCEPLRVPPEWRAAADAALAGGPGGAAPRVAVAGAKGAGKSTLSRSPRPLPRLVFLPPLLFYSILLITPPHPISITVLSLPTLSLWVPTLSF